MKWCLQAMKYNVFGRWSLQNINSEQRECIFLMYFGHLVRLVTWFDRNSLEMYSFFISMWLESIVNSIVLGLNIISELNVDATLGRVKFWPQCNPQAHVISQSHLFLGKMQYLFSCKSRAQCILRVYAYLGHVKFSRTCSSLAHSIASTIQS